MINFGVMFGFVNNCKNTIGYNGYERFGYYDPNFDYHQLERFDKDHYFRYVRELKECEDLTKWKFILTILSIFVLSLCVCFCSLKKPMQNDSSITSKNNVMKNKNHTKSVKCINCNVVVTISFKLYHSKFLCKSCFSHKKNKN